MVADEARFQAYKKAFLYLGSETPGKIWLEVGAGTGVLSLQALDGGHAAFIHCVEASAIYRQIEVVLNSNEHKGRYKVYNARIEEVELSPVETKVDYIFSEFMGYFLLHENMLQSVLIAKDRFLKERLNDKDDAMVNQPLVIPYSCHIFLAAYSNLAHSEEMLKGFIYS